MSLSHRLAYDLFLLNVGLTAALVGLAWWRFATLPAPRRWYAVYLTLFLTAELLQLALARLNINNHWVGYTIVPLITAAFLMAFSRWQADATVRKLVQWLVPLCALFWLPPLLGWEEVRGFSLLTSTSQALICLTVATFTLVRRWLESPVSPVRQDWFWIGAGAMFYFGAYALLSPLSRYLMSVGSTETVLQMTTVRGGVAILATILYWRGFLVAAGEPSPRPQAVQAT